MTTIEFLGKLRRLGVKLAQQGGDELQVSAPDGVLTTDLQKELEQRKQEILAMMRQVRGHSEAKVPGLTRAARDGRLPLSYAQYRLWFLDRLQPGSSLYNM